MNNKQYIAALTKALSGLDKASRNDIVMEIQSHATESGDTLWERFGAPDQLAQQYLEGEIVAKPLAAKIWGISKKLFIAVGVATLSLIGIALIIFWWLRLDSFDYANESAPELTDASASWLSEPWTDNVDIKLDQASVVFYWHDEPAIRYSCKGQKPIQFDGSLVTLSRSKCLVFLPNTPTTINAFQSQLVIVRPEQSLDIELKQAELKMAENGNSYRYSIDASRTNLEDLSSDEQAMHEIRIKSLEATISEYQY